MKEDSPLKGIVTSESSPSSSEIEDEDCKFGMEDNEGIPGMSPASESTGAETEGRMGVSEDEGAAAQMPREDRKTVQ